MRRIEIDTRLLVFAKAPRAGEVKTRLIPLLGATGAAALQRRLIDHTLAVVCGAALGTVELHCAPDGGDAFLRGCAERYGVLLVPQEGADLGERMACAFERALARERYALLVGSDCAVLTATHLHEARNALAGGADAVFAPAEDGGYALVGLARGNRALFEGVSWGEASVMNQTRKRLSQLGWRWRELQSVWDVDRPEDYRRLTALRRDKPIVPG